MDAIILLEDCLGLTRSKVLSSPDLEISKDQLHRLNSDLSLRLEHLPMAYIRKHVEFYGRTFYVDKSVLIPRPETESFIELLIKLKPHDLDIVADVGAGSGCIGISAKLETPYLSVELLDISPGAVKIAQKNAKLLRANVEVVESDLLKKATKQYDIILANLPYIPTQYKFDRSTEYEPRLALIGGAAGLELYARLWLQIKNLKMPPKYVMTESLTFQHQDMEAMANSNGYYLDTTNGLVQLYKLSTTSGLVANGNTN